LLTLLQFENHDWPITKRGRKYYLLADVHRPPRYGDGKVIPAGTTTFGPSDPDEIRRQQSSRLRISFGHQPQLGFVEDRNHLVAEIDFVFVEQV
jgi:hypothetical protein